MSTATPEPSVVLVTGPAGAGKTTVARGIAERLGWTHLSEDDHWVRHGWSGLRSLEQEGVVQREVATELLAAADDGRGVALEFILYKAAPNPLTSYQGVLSARGIPCTTIVLKPTVDEILERMERRGRPNDIADPAFTRTHAERQVRILGADDIDPRWVIDPSGRTIDEVLAACLAKLGSASRPS